MHAHVRAREPEETCGLIAGMVNNATYIARLVIPITNILHRTDGYRMNPEEQIQAFLHLEACGYELIGIYHSHPLGPDHPSRRDIAESYYPECAYLIWSGQTLPWQCTGYMIREEQVSWIPIIHDVYK